MARSLTVYNRSGVPNRQVYITGRNHTRPEGRITFIQNAGTRQEADMLALKTLLQAGDVVIPLSPYECDLMVATFGVKMPVGKNVEVQTPRAVPWEFDVHDGWGLFQIRSDAPNRKLWCEPCEIEFRDGLSFGRHRRDHLLAERPKRRKKVAA